MPTMTLRQWKTSLGNSIALGEAPGWLGVSVMEVARAIRLGQLQVREFRAHDGRVFRRIRMVDLERYQQRYPKMTIEGMKRAFQKMADGDAPTRKAA